MSMAEKQLVLALYLNRHLVTGDKITWYDKIGGDVPPE